MNLACKAVISAVSKIDLASEPTTDAEFVSAFEAVSGDPIATLRAAIRAVTINIYACCYIYLTDYF